MWDILNDSKNHLDTYYNTFYHMMMHNAWKPRVRPQKPRVRLKNRVSAHMKNFDTISK